jgi:mRNA-degrading endonuclease RelE of RelBE toxin-antitoxin system
VEEQRKIVWNSSALKTMSQALRRISEESIQGAELVEKGIIRKLRQASFNPYRFPPDKLKNKNNGNFRYFTTHSYRLSYRIKETEIRVLIIRHVKRKPKNY